jgi:hypothetical protein
MMTPFPSAPPSGAVFAGVKVLALRGAKMKKSAPQFEFFGGHEFQMNGA